MNRSILLFVLVLMSCATTSGPNPELGERQVMTLVPHNVYYRRPLKPADPFVSPGGQDYVSIPPPNASYDCAPMTDLTKDLSMKDVRECFVGIQNHVTVNYLLRRADAPYYELKKDSNTPECIQKLLPQILLPREIFFQTNEKDHHYACYSSRLPLEEDEFFWVKVPKARKQLTLVFPLARHLIPSDDNAMRRQFLAWALALFFNDETRTISSKYVPEPICRACMGEQNMMKDSDPPVPLWP